MLDYQEILDNLFDGVYTVDKDRTITFWNNAAERITGYDRSEVLGFSCADNILQHIDESGCTLCVDGCPLHETIHDGQMRESRIFLHHKDGHRVPVHVRISPLKNEAGEITGGIEVFSDNTKGMQVLKHLEELKQEVYLDPLLEIGNRRYAEMVFEMRIHELRSFGAPCGVLLMDIDKFKQVNDTYGHNTGDDVLRMAARSIKNTLRDLDTTIRWGGDEIAILLSNITEQGLKDIAERIRIMIANSFIMIGEEKISVTTSIGGTFANAEDSLDSVIERVDELMYTSKQAGGNSITTG